MAKSLFPEKMLEDKAVGETLTLESIASKLDYFETQVQLVHWQTQKV